MSTNALRALIVVMFITLSIALIFVVKSLGNNADPTIEDRQYAEEEWTEAGPAAQEIICGLWEMSPNNVRDMLIEEGNTSAHADAKMELMKRECSDE